MDIKSIKIKGEEVFYKDTLCNYPYTTTISQFAADLFARTLSPAFSAASGKWYYIQEQLIKEASNLVSIDEIGYYNSNKTGKEKELINKLVTILFGCIDRACKIPKTKSYSVALFDSEKCFIGCVEFIRENSTKINKHFLNYSDKCELTFFQAFATKERLGKRDAKIITKEEAASLYK